MVGLNVLVTLGDKGAMLLTKDGNVIEQACCPVPKGGEVVDETGAGDCFRAGFAVKLVEGRPLSECLAFASAAGAICVSRMGAIPSCPYRDECTDLVGERSYHTCVPVCLCACVPA